jgi:hypothetical protein
MASKFIHIWHFQNLSLLNYLLLIIGLLCCGLVSAPLLISIEKCLQFCLSLLIIFVCCGLESAYWFLHTTRDNTPRWWLVFTIFSSILLAAQNSKPVFSCPLFSGPSDWGKGAQELWFKNVKVIFIFKHSSTNSNKTYLELHTMMYIQSYRVFHKWMIFSMP